MKIKSLKPKRSQKVSAQTNNAGGFAGGKAFFPKIKQNQRKRSSKV
jgi:hypothetical protein